jgi:putative transposase
VDGRETFSDDADRETYIGLLRRNLVDAGASVLGWCLMTNHVHLVAIPEREDSMAVLLRRVHGRYAQYFNARHERAGHLWQNRFFACMLGPGHLWAALAYVEQNPLRAGMVTAPADYRWSSAAAHFGGRDISGVVDLNWWRREYDGTQADWARTLGGLDRESAAALRQCTHAGRPYGEVEFVCRVSDRFDRHWTRGRPKKHDAPSPLPARLPAQLALSADLGWLEKSRSSG